MSEALQEKIVSTIIRVGVTALTGTGLAGVFSTTWIGRRAYESFRDSLDVLYLPHPPLPDEVFQTLTTQVLLPPGVEVGLTFLMIVIALLLAVVAHVLYRKHLQEASGGRLRSLYRRYYFALTLLLTLTLTVAVAAPPTAGVLRVCWALLALTGGLYLLLYVKDVQQGGFVPRFIWIALALLFVVDLLLLPRVHGQRFLDLDLVQVQVPGNDHSPYRYALSSRSDVLFDIDYSGKRVSVAVEIADHETRWEPLDKQQLSMRHLLRNTEPPALADEAAVANEVQHVLTRALGGGAS